MFLNAPRYREVRTTYVDMRVKTCKTRVLGYKVKGYMRTCTRCRLACSSTFDIGSTYCVSVIKYHPYVNTYSNRSRTGEDKTSP